MVIITFKSYDFYHYIHTYHQIIISFLKVLKPIWKNHKEKKKELRKLWLLLKFYQPFLTCIFEFNHVETKTYDLQNHNQTLHSHIKFIEN
jgi:hypothetical protein